MKDSLRLIIWVIVASFTLGGLWAQRKADIATITDRMEKSEAVNRDLASKVDAAQQGAAAILTSLQGIHTELHYVNEKIDVLRQDLRDTRTTASSTPKGRE